MKLLLDVLTQADAQVSFSFQFEHESRNIFKVSGYHKISIVSYAGEAR